MVLSPKIALLLLGLVIGGVVGYMTRPEAAQIKIGGTSIEFENNKVSANSSSSSSGMTSGQSQHMLLYTLAGGVIGLLVGFAVDRRR